MFLSGGSIHSAALFLKRYFAQVSQYLKTVLTKNTGLSYDQHMYRHSYQTIFEMGDVFKL